MQPGLNPSLIRRRIGILSMLVATVCLAPRASWANGVDFFEDALKPGPDALLYTGRVTDMQGKPIPNTQIYVMIDKLSIAMEVHGDSKGNYQTHDIRKALEMIGEKVRPQDIRILVKRSYYKQVEPKSETVPLQDRGRFVINFRMVRD